MHHIIVGVTAIAFGLQFGRGVFVVCIPCLWAVSWTFDIVCGLDRRAKLNPSHSGADWNTLHQVFKVFETFQLALMMTFTSGYRFYVI